MKIILTQNVPRIGVKGQILDMTQVYAMNAFVNKGLARLATVNDEKLIKNKEDKKREVKENESDKSSQLFSKLEKDSAENAFVIKKKIDAKGNFYAKLSKQDIENVIFEKAIISINESQIFSDTQSIIKVGEYGIELKVNNKKYKILIKIVKE